MRLPSPRGVLSEALINSLQADRPLPDFPARQMARLTADPAVDTTCDEDLQLTLLVCYELSYRGLDGIEDRWEWDAGLLALRTRIEAAFERNLREQLPLPEQIRSGDVDRALSWLVTNDDGPPLSRYLQKRATLEQAREFAVHRSIYQLKEADPHSWALPRLAGRAKAALLEIQFDEYGEGRLDRMHSTLFAGTLRSLDLDDSYGAYVDNVPASTLATVNVISLFGLQRRLRGALMGHLAAYEMSSSIPNRRYGDGLRRHGYGRAATEFYDEHVEADAVHEQIAAVDLCGSLVAAEPHLRDDVLFGASAALALDNRFAGALLSSWQQGGTSLRLPLPAGSPGVQGVA
jgi:hypothetical protein